MYRNGKLEKFRIEPFLKGSQDSKGQSPLLVGSIDFYSFSRLPKCSDLHRLAQQDPKYCLKLKSVLFGSAFRERPLLQVSPSFPNSPPDCLENSPFSERTACKRFGSCEKVWESNQGANEGLCPFNPHAPFKKGSILNFYDFLFREGFHSRGSFGGFQAPQRALENTGRSDR